MTKKIEILDAGHTYKMFGVGDCPPQIISFVKNRGEKYSGNTGKPHGGILCQDLMRVLIDRTKYLNGQGSCMETEMALENLRSALAWFEVRAARCRGGYIELVHSTDIDSEPTCSICGHNQCDRGDNHERMPGTYRDDPTADERCPNPECEAGYLKGAVFGDRPCLICNGTGRLQKESRID